MRRGLALGLGLGIYLTAHLGLAHAWRPIWSCCLDNTTCPSRYAPPVNPSDCVWIACPAGRRADDNPPALVPFLLNRGTGSVRAAHRKGGAG